MTSHDPRLENLQKQIQNYVTAFRAIWVFNLGAAVWGIVTHHTEVTLIAVVSALIALVGVGLARRGLTSVAKAIARCQSLRAKLKV